MNLYAKSTKVQINHSHSFTTPDGTTCHPEEFRIMSKGTSFQTSIEMKVDGEWIELTTVVSVKFTANINEDRNRLEIVYSS